MNSSYHKLPSYQLVNTPDKTWRSTRFLILQSSLATLMQLRSEEENDLKIATYTASIALIQKELSAATVRP